MMIQRSVVGTLLGGVMVFGAGAVSGQTYPSKPVRIVTVGYGSSTDIAMRLIAQAIPGSFGQRLVVENRGIAAIEVVAQARPDGYTLLHYTNPLWLMPVFRADVSWDVTKDFVPVTQTLTSPNVLVVHPSLPVTSVRDLIQFAKARPGQLNYGSSSSGSGNHVAAELFKALAGLDIVRINYKSGGQAVSNLVVGEVQLVFAAAGSSMPFVKSGKLRGLAITSAKPSALVPGLPTLAASGLPAYESSSVAGLFAPAGTPEAIVNELNREFVRVLHRADIKERLVNASIEAVGSSPAELAATVKSEIARMSKVVKDAGLRE